jgi:hypothetical protein
MPLFLDVGWDGTGFQRLAVCMTHSQEDKKWLTELLVCRSQADQVGASRVSCVAYRILMAKLLNQIVVPGIQWLIGLRPGEKFRNMAAICVVCLEVKPPRIFE